MAIERWEPFRDLIAMQERMNRLFDETLSRSKVNTEEFVSGTWSPCVDIYETEDSIRLMAELPGIDKNDVSVEVKEGTLLLKGEKKFCKDVKEEDYHRLERSYGSFLRSFALPNTVDKENVKARYKDGVLEITLTKVKEARPRHIKVAVE